jgi:hypothetical protein
MTRPRGIYPHGPELYRLEEYRDHLNKGDGNSSFGCPPSLTLQELLKINPHVNSELREACRTAAYSTPLLPSHPAGEAGGV